MNIFLLLSSFLFVSMIRYCQCLCEHENGRNFFGPDCKLLCHCANKTEKCDEVTGNCSSGCAKDWVGPGCQYRNLASGGVARHSQTEKGKPTAQKAIDEKESSCSFAVKKDTDIDPPWWRVTFQTMRYISGVEFLTLEKYLDQFRYFRVLIGNVSWQDRNNKSVNPTGIECYSHNGYQDLVSPFIAMCDTPILGNQVRIVMNATDSKLVLCDVRLYGGRNLAIGKAINTSDQQIPNKKISTHGILNGKKCLLLSSDVQQQWWQISFSRPHLVQAVTVYSYIHVNLRNVLIQTKRQQNDSWISLASPNISNDVMNGYFAPIEELSAIRLLRNESSIRQAKEKRFVLCEVQIWGDCGKNYCGFDCSKPCFCKRGYIQTKDDKMAGICQLGCEPGWKGEGKSCDEHCSDGYWGEKCNKSCGKCLDGTSCRKTDGLCEDGCDAGWQGNLCSEKCADGKWGQECKRTCGKCLNGSVCRKTDGQCEKGCDVGWQGDLCSEECAVKKWGQKCKKTCGNCFNGTVCRKTDGKCKEGCAAGWQGDLCSEKCAGKKWGQKCKRTCGNCFNGTVCRKTDGKCKEGCAAGWQGGLCSEKCADGKWGQTCNRTCGNCLNGSVCRNTDGQCEEGCDAGWQGDLCSENCADSYWGQKCNRTCGNCLNGTVCRKTDGQCEEGCDIGWQGDLCSENCADGYWGEKCSRSCTNCLTGTVCRKTDGHCEEGCDAGWHGSLCSMAEKGTGTKLSLGVLVAITAGIIILISVLVAALFIVRDNFKKRKNNSTNQTVFEDRQCRRVSHVAAEREVGGDGHSEVIELQACQVEPQSTQDAEQSVYANVGSLVAQDDVHCISVSNLERFMKSTTPEQLFEEFKSLPCGLIHPAEAAITPENRSKNRYVKVYPYDHCRVKLLTASNASNSDYINASFIKGLHRDKAYIAASAPVDTSLDDFWQMIWEQELESIVMVTNVVEAEKVKCLQYWPDVNSSRTYSRVNVETNIETEFADFTIRTFLVSLDGEFKQREVHHYHFTGWPDKYVPDGSTGLVHFLQTVRNKSRNSKSAWLVHCSAGVGRTGTFIALDLLFAQGQQTGSVNVYQCIYDLRQQRVHMVQTEEQYKFIHEALFELFVLPCQPVQMYLFEEMYRNLLRNDPESNVTKLKLQYQELEANRYRKYWLNDDIKKFQSHDDNQNSQSNDNVQNSEPNDDSKNCQQNEITDGEISAALLPGNVDFSRLSNNVFYIPSFTSQTGYITCPHPTEKTTEDFIQLILREATSLVVSLDSYTCRRQSLPTEYLPTEGSTLIGPYRVKVTKVYETGYYILRHYVIIDGNHEFRTNFMTYKGWLLKHTIPSSVHEMLNLIQYVRKERSSAAQPILVLCSDGFTKSGLFCVLLSTIERMKAEEEVAIAQVMRKAQLKNPKVITCFEQYKFCHDFVQLYLQSGETYVNLI